MTNYREQDLKCCSLCTHSRRRDGEYEDFLICGFGVTEATDKESWRQGEDELKAREKTHVVQPTGICDNYA